MEILSSGKNAYIHTCDRCGCVFAYGKDDITQTPSKPNEYFDAVDCPECGANQVVTRKLREDR